MTEEATVSLDPRNPGSDPETLDVLGPSAVPAPSPRPVDDVVLIVSGEVDLATRDELLVRLLTLAMTSRRRVVIDLADVDFLDPAGARALRHGHKLADDLGVEVVLRSPQHQVRRVLDLTGTAALFAIE
ncbi:MAG: anti-sigma factor antagonist [Actinomycetia bacterium]|nr:anti-sigma factor antagonist [Actinomycetes bacterium]